MTHMLDTIQLSAAVAMVAVCFWLLFDVDDELTW